MRPYLSIVIPVLNEATTLATLHQEILAVCRQLNKPFEVIFVNDGSTDKSLEVMQKLAPLKVINLRKTFGQTAALDAGIKAAEGELIVTMDGDGQNDPADIPTLISKLTPEYDVISGWRKDRQDPFIKRCISRTANLLRKFLINDGIHDSGCTLKVYRRECFETLDLYGEMHRFIPALLKLKGFRVGEEAVHHRPRTAGKTKYNWKRIIKGFLDMLAVWFWKKYANRPLHLFGTVGLFLIFISLCSGVTVLYKKIWLGVDLSDTVLTELAMFSFLVGMQFFVFGLFTDILSKSYYASSKDRAYVIKDIIENEDPHA